MGKRMSDSSRRRKATAEHKRLVKQTNDRFAKALLAIVKTNKHGNVRWLCDRIISFCEYVKMTLDWQWKQIVATTIFHFTKKKNTIDMIFGRAPSKRLRHGVPISPVLKKMLEQKNAKKDSSIQRRNVRLQRLRRCR